MTYNMYGLDQVANFRDLCGDDEHPMKVKNGYLKRNIIYRTSHLHFGTTRDIGFIRDVIGIKTYIDLRSDEGTMERLDGEVFDTYGPSPIPRVEQGIYRRRGETRRINLPLNKYVSPRKLTQAERDGDKHALPDTWFQLKQRDPVTLRYIPFGKDGATMEERLFINNEGSLHFCQDIILDCLKEFTYEQNYPMLFGCATGKDRTGLLGCLLLGALGANDEDIINDYLISNKSVIHNGALARRNFIIARNMYPEEYEDMKEDDMPFSPASSDSKNQSMASVYRSVMVKTIEVIKRDFGGFKKYFDLIGFTKKDRKRFRKLAVVKHPEKKKDIHISQYQPTSKL